MTKGKTQADTDSETSLEKGKQTKEKEKPQNTCRVCAYVFEDPYTFLQAHSQWRKPVA